MSPARPDAPAAVRSTVGRTAPAQVTAMVVTDGLGDHLSRTLTALAGQTRPPTTVLVVDVAPELDPAVVALVGGLWPRREGARSGAWVVSAAEARTFGDAVRTALAARGTPPVSPRAHSWLWLLHDDSAPEPAALAELLRAVEVAPSVGIAGCKQQTWSGTPQVIEVGLATSRFGRRMTGLDGPEVDQGQHDARDDVLAVGTAGALVRQDVWDALGGTDPALGPYGDGLELSRRARLAGHRVVVVPSAVVRHAQASIPAGGVLGRPGWDTRRSTQARRVAFLHSQLVGVPAVLVPVVAVLAVLSSVIRALGRVAIKEPNLVTAELMAPWSVLLRPGRIAAARRRARRTAELPRRALRPLQVGWTDVARQFYDRRLDAAEGRRSRIAPSELELSELAALRDRRRATFAALVVVALAVSATALGALLATGGVRVAGGALALGDAGVGGLWSAATSWWTPGGFGEPSPPDPFLWVLVPLTAMLGTAGQAAVALLVGAILLGAVGAWFAAGAVTRSVALRAWAALVWAAAPALLTSIESGRLGVVVAHAALPWFALGVARGVGVARVDVVQSGLVGAQRVVPVGDGAGATEVGVPVAELAPAERSPARPAPSATAEPSLAAAASAALALVVVTAGAPVLLPAALVVLVAVAPVVRRRRRLAWIAVPALAMHGPMIVAAIAALGADWWRVLVAEPGVPLAQGRVPAWQHLLGWPVPAPEWSVLGSGQVAGALPLVAAGILLALALPALLLPVPSARAARVGWFAAAVGIAVAVVAGRTLVGVAETVVTDPSGAQTTWEPVTASPGPGVSLAVAGLLLAALVGAARVRDSLARSSFGWRQLTVGVIALLAVVGPAVTLGVWTWQHRGGAGLQPGVAEAVVPAAGRQMQRSADAMRVLSLRFEADGTVRAEVLRDDGPQLTELSRLGGVREVLARDDHPAELEVADVSARLAAGSSSDVAGDLGRLGIGAVLVPGPSGAVARTELVGRLDATPGLQRVTETAPGVIWRVDAAGAGTTASWARLAEGDGAPVPVAAAGGRVDTTIDAGGTGRRLVLAERADPGWRAELDGRPLRAVPTNWHQTFEVGAGSGHLVVEHAPVVRTPWLAVQAIVLLLTGLLAVPVRRRRGGVR